MQVVYKLTHKILEEIDSKTGEEICDTKLLGFFSSQEVCEEAIAFYKQLNGFKNFPERFFSDKIEANIDDFNTISGEFRTHVYYLLHKWCDGEYDYTSSLGYYSSQDQAKEAEKKYRLDPEFAEYPDGFAITGYKIDQKEWMEGFEIEKKIYELIHSNLLEIDPETGEEICDTKLLGFFSSKEACEEAISFYIQLAGFKDFPERFFITQIEADVDEFNGISGQFGTHVYYLSHEWYDGEYDYVSSLGYYSSQDKAKEAEKKYRLDPDLIEHQDGFAIAGYEIDHKEWTEGFCTWEDMDKCVKEV